ncbi:hypothetical protein [Lentibacillus sp. CBA3610]|uniref:hypothetical protein n=1 Tax=Lentibacillus sp. CBA3610 TaxID=2518176 RepID=UPI0015962448|nr:hypothetical protein [Lentibacillus sp. CBA3610]QKY69154.1 hypothetical protein Len3610_05605 [Lentibacillus sp. CBA3610]
MSFDETSSGREQPMRIILPNLYNEITKQLEEQHNIHPYDIQAKAVTEDSGYQVIIYFGDGFSHRKSKHFSSEAIEKMDTDESGFIEELGDACKEVMIADYFKMMRPT